MNLLGVLIYVYNVGLAMFAFNQVKTEQQKVLIPHGIAWITISLLSVYFFVNEYFIESILLTIICGLPLVFSPGSTPEFLYRNIKRFNIAMVVSVVITLLLGYIIIF